MDHWLTQAQVLERWDVNRAVLRKLRLGGHVEARQDTTGRQAWRYNPDSVTAAVGEPTNPFAAQEQAKRLSDLEGDLVKMTAARDKAAGDWEEATTTLADREKKVLELTAKVEREQARVEAEKTLGADRLKLVQDELAALRERSDAKLDEQYEAFAELNAKLLVATANMSWRARRRAAKS